MTSEFHKQLGEGRLENRLGDAKPLYTKAEALVEANRCLYCYDAPCITACPTSINIPKFIKQIASDNLRGSAQTILSANMLGVSCARVCPVEVLCAGDCVYNDLNHQPIAIGRLQRYATETALADESSSGRKLFEAAPSTGKSVALIGAGPASLACAAHLALGGVSPVIYERGPLPGGLNTTGVAPYKLHAEAALDEVNWLLSHGAILKTGVSIGKDISFAQLQKDHDAVFIGVGLGSDRLLSWQGDCVWGATDLIRAIKNDPAFCLPEGASSAVIVGGGNTAIDIARELAMLGLPEVTMVYRRGQAEMSGYEHEMAAARKYGVQLKTGYNPKGVEQDASGTHAVFSHRENDERLAIRADLIVMAVGQQTWAAELGADFELNDNGTVKVDAETRQTTVPRVYAGGDCINGGKEVVNAAADGREAAKAIIASLGL